jgi:hypothetical protein
MQGCNLPDGIFLVALPFKSLGVEYIFDHHDINPGLVLVKHKSRSSLYKALSVLEKPAYLVSDAVWAENQGRLVQL